MTPAPDTYTSPQKTAVVSTCGRLGRLRWIAHTVVANAAAFLAAAVAGIASGMADLDSTAVTLLITAVYLVYYFRITIRRSHDMGWSGWTSILSLIPLAGLVWALVPGTRGANAYGAPTAPNTWPVILTAFLMPGVLVIGIVFALALPAYSHYQKRATEASTERPQRAPSGQTSPSREPQRRAPENQRIGI